MCLKPGVKLQTLSLITTNRKETKMHPEDETQEPSTFAQVQVTQVSNGFITEVSHSSQPDKDGQERAAVHANIDELLSYLRETFQTN